MNDFFSRLCHIRLLRREAKEKTTPLMGLDPMTYRLL